MRSPQKEMLWYVREETSAEAPWTEKVCDPTHAHCGISGSHFSMWLSIKANAIPSWLSPHSWASTGGRCPGFGTYSAVQTIS
eukprot:6884411-Prorocentrum_lima.AAC.1